MTDQGKNRRQFVRVYRNFILSCHLKGKADIKYEMSQVNNISRGGVNFSSTAAFPKGSELIIELSTPFISEQVRLEGVVLESREKIKNLIYELRIQFQNVSPQAEEILVKIEKYASTGE